jgi:alginate O-acetyltransferase complex protein AlgJ
LTLREMTVVSPLPIGRFEFTWRVAPQAIGWDRDVADLFNRLWPDVSYPTTIVARAGAPQPCARTPRLLALGGSFLHHILISMTDAACPPEVDYWFYMRTEDNGVELGHYHRPPGDVSDGEKVASELPVLAENLRDADFVLLEENEANLGETAQVGHLLAAVRKPR